MLENRVTSIQKSLEKIEKLEHVFVEGNPMENPPNFINSSNRVKDINKYVKRSFTREG